MVGYAQHFSMASVLALLVPEGNNPGAPAPFEMSRHSPSCWIARSKAVRTSSDSVAVTEHLTLLNNISEIRQTQGKSISCGSKAYSSIKKNRIISASWHRGSAADNLIMMMKG
jgi:hypothetical protein